MEVEFTIRFDHIKVNRAVVNENASLLSQNLGELLVNSNKQALVTLGAVASGDTLRSIRDKRVTQRGISTGTEGFYHRQVLGSKGYKFIRDGRKPGKKMPVRMVGTGKRGKIFEPLPEMLKWFTVLGIPRRAWFPIMRKISQRGIKPRDVPGKAVRSARPLIRAMAGVAGVQIARGIIVRAT